MATMFVTGVSGVGKSTALASLRALGTEVVEVVDTDDPGWRRPASRAALAGEAVEPDWIWDEAAVGALLDRPRTGHLVVAGCVENQGRFRDRFDHVVLLTASPDVVAERLATRTTNPYGRTPEQLARVLDEIGWVEPLLRRSATREIDTGATALEDVVALILADLDGGAG